MHHSITTILALTALGLATAAGPAGCASTPAAPAASMPAPTAMPATAPAAATAAAATAAPAPATAPAAAASAPPLAPAEPATPGAATAASDAASGAASPAVPPPRSIAPRAAPPAASAAPAPAPGNGLRPYEASYRFVWSGMNAGTSSFALRREGAGEWSFISRNQPRGLFRLVPSADLTLASRMRIGPDGVQPLLFTATESDGSRQAEVHFDWAGNRATGVVEDMRIDMALKPGVQDDLSVQVALIQALASGRTPGGISVFDKRGIRDYEFTRVGAETLATVAGAVDTIVYRSQRIHSPRSTRYWCAPRFGYVPVRAEQERKGEVEWTMSLLSIHMSEPGQP
jgi:hypothetical protein